MSDFIYFNFQHAAIRALQSKADFITLVAPAGHGKTTLARYFGNDNTKIIDPADDISWETFEAMMRQEPERVILTMNQRPGLLDIHDRIKTKISQGLIVHMDGPEGFDRLDVVEKLNLPEKWQQDIAGIVTNFPALIGVAKAVEVEKPTRREQLAKILTRYTTKELKIVLRYDPRDVMDMMLTVLEEAYFVRREFIVGPRRTANLTRPRHIGYYALRELTGLALQEVGNHFGNRDHSTVLYAINKVKRDPEMLSEGNQLIKTVRARMGGGVKV